MEHFYRGNKLPHWHPQGATYFVTARLYGSIPKPVIEQMKAAYQLALYEIQFLKITPENAESLLPDELTKTIERIRRQKNYEAGKRYFSAFDNFLDSNLNAPYWLQQPTIAQLTEESMPFYAEKYFEL